MLENRITVNQWINSSISDILDDLDRPTRKYVHSFNTRQIIELTELVNAKLQEFVTDQWENLGYRVRWFPTEQTANYYNANLSEADLWDMRCDLQSLEDTIWEHAYDQLDLIALCQTFLIEAK